MKITTTILTVGTALRHAQSHEARVHLLVGGAWVHGSVRTLDGKGVAIAADDGEITVVRMAGITAVRIEPTERADFSGPREAELASPEAPVTEPV